MPNDGFSPRTAYSLTLPMGTSAHAASGQLPAQLPASVHRSHHTPPSPASPAPSTSPPSSAFPSNPAQQFSKANQPFASRASSAILASVACVQPASPLLKASTPPTPPVFGPAGSNHPASALAVRNSLPLSLPLPLLSSLNADLSLSTASPAGKPALRRMSSMAGARQSLMTVLDSIDWFLPQRVRERRGRSIGLEEEQDTVKDGAKAAAESEHLTNGDGAHVDGLAASSSSTSVSSSSSPSSSSASSSSLSSSVAPLSCVTCRQFGQHVCVWKWRGLVLILILLLLSCLLLAAIANYYHYTLLTTVYYTVSATSLLTLLHIHQLPPAATDPFFASFPSHMTAGLFVLTAFQSLYLGMSQPFSLFFPSVAVTAAAIFLVNTAAGIRYYLYSLLLIVSVWVRSWWQDDCVVGDEHVLNFLREQYIIYTPLCLTLLTCLLLLIQQWLTHSISLLTQSISNLTHLKNSAIAASKLKSEFLANVSHDIRTPMNSILGFLQLSVGDQSLSDETRECLQTAFNSAEDLLSLLNDILDLTKIESGYLRFESIEFALQSVYEKSVKTFASQAAKKGVELIYEVDPQLQAKQYAMVKGDPSRLAQVLNNLLSNAVKFTSSKGKSGGHSEIMVRVSLLTPIQPGHIHVHTAVSDTGEGISAAGLSRLFQPFIQADSTISRRHGGTGLGLAISSELVKLSGGRIWCQSEVGKGSSFNFTSQFQAIEPTSNQQPTDLFSALSADTHIHDGNLVSPPPPLSSSPTAIIHASSEPMPSRRIGGSGEQKRTQVRVLLAVHNPTNAEVISRAISYWTNREYADCSASTPCAKCQNSPFSFNPAVAHAHHHSTTNPLGQHSPPQHTHPTSLLSPNSTSHNHSHHTTYIEIIPSHRVQTDHVVQELLWAKTTRQPYDLLVLDENAPQLDTVRLMSLMLKKRIYSMSRPAVLILTQRLLSPVLRGNGVSTYVLISKPVMAGDIHKSLSLLLREQPAELRSMPVLPRRLGQEARVADAPGPDAVAEAKAEKGYVASSRRPKEAVDEHEAAVNNDSPAHTKLDELHLDTANLDKTESNGVLREPSILIREEHGSGIGTHSTSAPSSPVGPAALSSPTPSSAPVDGGVEYLQNLPASQSLTWDGRTQSFPDFFFRQSSVNASQSLTQQTTKPRSQSVAADPPISASTTQHVIFTAPGAATGGACGAAPDVKTTVQSEESEKLVAPVDAVDPRVKALTNGSAAPRSSFELDSPRASSDFVSGAVSSSVSASTSVSKAPSSPSSALQSPQNRASSARDSHPTTASSRDPWPASPPRHTADHAVHIGSKSSMAPSRRLLPAHQAMPSHVLAGTDGRSSTPSSPVVRNRLASFSSSSTTSGSRASSVSDISPAMMSSGPVSPASAASVDSAYSPDSTVPSPSHPVATTTSSRLQPAADSVHVLCVDDNAVNLKVASKMLSRLGYVPHTLRSGEEAIAFLDDMRTAWQRRQQAKAGEWPELIRGPSAEEDVRRRGEQDVQRWVVLMDVIMDGMNGMEATRVLRAHGHAMPILALTANVMAGDKDKAMESGMDGFICKPLRMEELETALKAAVKKRDEGAAGEGGGGGEAEKERLRIDEEPVVLLGSEL